jgi:hypothetical protein
MKTDLIVSRQAPIVPAGSAFCLGGMQEQTAQGDPQDRMEKKANRDTTAIRHDRRVLIDAWLATCSNGCSYA